MKQIIPDAQIGSTLITHFTCSTSWMLHKVHLLSGVGVAFVLSSPSCINAALFKKLQSIIHIIW